MKKKSLISHKEVYDFAQDMYSSSQTLFNQHVCATWFGTIWSKDENTWVLCVGVSWSCSLNIISSEFIKIIFLPLLKQSLPV